MTTEPLGKENSATLQNKPEEFREDIVPDNVEKVISNATRKRSQT